MSDILFNCQICHQLVEVAEDMSGQLVDCPHCTNPVEVPFRRQLQNQSRPDFRGLNKAKRSPSFNSTGAWSGGEMTLLVILTVLIPISGIIFGVIGLSKEPRKKQGAILLCISIFVMTILAIVSQIDFQNNVRQINSEYNQEMRTLERDSRELMQQLDH